MNVLLSQYLNFQSWKEKMGERRGAEEEGGVGEGKVSYSVSGYLQISWNWFPENFILNKYLELLEVKKG